MINAYGEEEITLLSDRVGAGVPDAAVVGAVLDDAAKQIDTYLGGRYQLPLTPVPDIANQWNRAIARFLLYRTDAPNNVIQLYKTAMSELVAAQRGGLTLEAAAVATATSGSAAEFQGTPRAFTPDTLRGF